MLRIDELSELEILERVDEYSLYCFYLEFEPVIGQKYRSRLRQGDDVASFGLYTRKYGGDLPHEFMWKDQGIAFMKNYGDIFYLVQVMYGLETRLEALIQVATDHGLLEGTTSRSKQIIITPSYKPDCRIRIKSRDMDFNDYRYWSSYNIGKHLLEMYHVSAVEYFFLFDTDIYPRMPRGRMYAYRIFNRYQLYQPYPKTFWMDWTDTCFPGLEQLSGQKDLLIVTKSMKDIMCLRSFGYEAVAPRAENMIPSEYFIEWLQTFKKVFMLLDNDGKSSAHLYPFEAVYIPEESGEKDPTDYVKRFGVPKTDSLLKRLFRL